MEQKDKMEDTWVQSVFSSTSFFPRPFSVSKMGSSENLVGEHGVEIKNRDSLSISPPSLLGTGKLSCEISAF